MYANILLIDWHTYIEGFCRVLIIFDYVAKNIMPHRINVGMEIYK